MVQNRSEYRWVHTVRTAQSFKATKIPDQEVSYLTPQARVPNFFANAGSRTGYAPNDADQRNPDPDDTSLGSKKYLQRALGQIPAAAQVQGDQLAISLQNWFQNFI